MEHKSLRIFNRVILILSILSVIGILVYASSEPTFTAGGLIVWAISPFLVLLAILKRTVSYRALLAITTLALLYTLSPYLYYDSLLASSDPQGALVVFFLPLYQLLALLIIFGTLGIASFILKKK